MAIPGRELQTQPSADPSTEPAPLLSVVITNHNYARYVRAAVDSALGQTYPGMEVVVVDDGSTDHSLDVLRRYGDRIRLFPQENQGQASAMNAGFARSRGALLVFLDADDVLEPGAARKLVAAWRPEVARVQGVVRLLAPDGSPSGGHLPTSPPLDGDVTGLLLESGSYPTSGPSGAAYARWALDRLLPIPEVEWRVAPDSYLALLAPFLGPVAAVREVIAGQRIHGGNKWATGELDPDRLRQHLEIDRLKERLLRTRLPSFGRALPDDWLFRNPSHLQSRLAHLRLRPESHPFPRDRRLRLAYRGVGATLRHHGFSPRKRAMLGAWFAAAALLPAGLAVPLIRLGYSRAARPRWLQRLIERRVGSRPED
jgi:glycosyltransferase involved in cell wall biosynthesis